MIGSALRVCMGFPAGSGGGERGFTEGSFSGWCLVFVFASSGPATEVPNRFVGLPVDGLVRLNNMCGSRDGLSATPWVVAGE